MIFSPALAFSSVAASSISACAAPVSPQLACSGSTTAVSAMLAALATVFAIFDNVPGMQKYATSAAATFAFSRQALITPGAIFM